VCSCGVSAVAQTCVATGDLNHSGGDSPAAHDVTTADVQIFVNHLSMSHESLQYPFAADLTGDCIVDREDLDELVWCHYTHCEPGPCCPWPGPITCCDPLQIFSQDTVRAVGEALVTYSAGTATVTNVGTTGDDGLRLYPNMSNNWKPAVHLALQNAELTQSGRKLSLQMTRVDTTMDMQWAAWLAGENTGSTLTMTLGLGLPTQSTITLTTSSDVGDQYEGQFTGNELMVSAESPTAPLMVSDVSCVIRDHLDLTVLLVQPVTFSVIGQTPPVTFTADRIRLSADNPYEALLGPIVITGGGMEWFAVTHSFPCCAGRVGDANMQGTYPQEVTISDIQTLVTAKFVQGACNGIVSCIAEGDANQSGGDYPTCIDISISDIQVLVNHLFIAGPANAPLADCL
jgi:hypothetical protein